jgi:O-antigen/teichoic acid export membrane protein
LNAASGVATVTSLGVGRAWIPSFFAIASSVVNLICNFILVPRYGINGAALGALLPQALVLPIFVFVVTRQLKFSSRELFSHGFLRPMICGFVQLLVLLALRRYVDSIVTLVVLCFASLAIYGLVALYGAITREERNFLFRLPALGVNQR